VKKMLTLAKAIIEENIDHVAAYLRQGTDVNVLDEYGFTPLIETAIADNYELAKLLIDYGADVKLQDLTGGTALHWAAENNNIRLAQLLLENGADPNAYTFAGQPVLVMPFLRQQKTFKKLLIKYKANLGFTQDYINAKLLGHMFELVGTADIIDVNNNFVEIDFEGFYLEFSLAIIAESLDQFNNHFAARELRQYGHFIKMIVSTINRAARLIKFQQYRVDTKKYIEEINHLIRHEPLIIPIGYEGHAITFIKSNTILVKCDRREDSRLYDNVVFYNIGRPEKCDAHFIYDLIYKKQTGNFINNELHSLLQLQPITQIKVTAQISGNCSWANVEACIPALFFLFFSEQPDFQKNLSRYKNIALNFFHKWREWNKNRALNFCIQRFKESDALRKSCKGELLAAILFQTCHEDNFEDKNRIESILEVLNTPAHKYILQNYVRTYCYEDISEEGTRFLRMLKNHGYQ
jgi:ankyrin repeat protein